MAAIVASPVPVAEPKTAAAVGAGQAAPAGSPDAALFALLVRGDEASGDPAAQDRPAARPQTPGGRPADGKTRPAVPQGEPRPRAQAKPKADAESAEQDQRPDGAPASAPGAEMALLVPLAAVPEVPAPLVPAQAEAAETVAQGAAPVIAAPAPTLPVLEEEPASPGAPAPQTAPAAVVTAPVVAPPLPASFASAMKETASAPVDAMVASETEVPVRVPAAPTVAAQAEPISSLASRRAATEAGPLPVAPPPSSAPAAALAAAPSAPPVAAPAAAGAGPPVHSPAVQPAVASSAAVRSPTVAVEAAPVAPPAPLVEAAAVVAAATTAHQPQLAARAAEAAARPGPAVGRGLALGRTGQAPGQAVAAAAPGAPNAPGAPLQSSDDLQLAALAADEAPVQPEFSLAEAPLDLAKAELPAQPASAALGMTSATALAAAGPAASQATGGTVAALAAQIVRRVEAKASRFEVQLDPHGLGQVTVSVRIDAQGRLSAALGFDNPAAAAQLQARSAELRASLEQAGFDLSRGGLSFDSADQGLGRQAHEDQGQGRNAAFRGRAFGVASEAADLADLAAAPQRRAIAANGLDLRI